MDLVVNKRYLWDAITQYNSRVRGSPDVGSDGKSLPLAGLVVMWELLF